MDKKALDGLALLHDLVPFLPVDRLHAILNNQPLPAEDYGTALFADISGFTALAERLAAELGPERGAEELNAQVNYTFVGLIDAVDRYHGSVLHFSGDGLTAWFTGENHALRAATASLAMQAVMAALMTALPDLRLKIGLGTGLARRFLPGDPAMGVYDVLAGPAITRMTQAEKRAGPAQVVLSRQTGEEIRGLLAWEPLAGGFVRLQPTIFAPTPPGAERWPSIRWMDHVDRAWEMVEACRPYLPASIYERLQAGHGAYMAELRTVTPLFLRFTGIDYNRPQAAQQLDELVRVAQTIVGQHGGYLNEVGVDDKGNILVALFGAPVALENPASRAAHAACALRTDLPHVKAVHCGLTCETVFAATVGSPMRRAYAAIGDGVNLAARLMIHARPGEILANSRAHLLAEDFAWEALPPIRVKGKVAPIRMYRLSGLAEDTQPLWPSGRFVARVRELQALNWALDASKTGQERILVMTGEPGLGKSHLLGQFMTMMLERGITWLSGAGSDTEHHTHYRAWREIFITYFDLDSPSKQSSRPAARKQVESYIAAIAPHLTEQTPLLNDVLQFDFPESAFTESLDPAQRHAALVDLLVTLLRAWLDEDALALVLDNAQWLDALSWDLLYHIAQQLGDRPLTILVAMRPAKHHPPDRLLALKALSATRELVLHPLNRENAEALAALHLGVTSLPPSIMDLIMEKTAGNPFFIKEIASVLQDSGIVQVEEGKAIIQGDPARLQLPDTVQGMIRSRLDHLSPDQQVLAKVAAVIGPQFLFRTLRDIQPLQLDTKTLRASLDTLDVIDLERVDTSDDDDPLYAFRHAITREVAYSSLSFSQRRQIHEAVARWYEHEYSDNLAPYYALLTHHWREAENRERELQYCYLAGKQAAAQYANSAAANYLERALEIIPPTMPAMQRDILLTLDEVYHRRGARDKQQTLLSTLSALAEERDDDDWHAQAGIRWARHYESVAAYRDSAEAARCAFQAAQRINDQRAMGLSSVYWGLALMRLGEFDAASQRLSQVYAGYADDIEAWRLDTLGLTYARMGRYSPARDAYEEALAKARRSGNRAAIGQTLNHLGHAHLDTANYDEARRCHSQALALHRTVGDRVGEAQSLASLGSLALSIGDYELAHNYLRQAHSLFQEVGDRSGEATTRHAIGRLTGERGDHDQARVFLQDALHLWQDIGDPYFSSLVLLDLALAETALDDLRQADAHVNEALTLSQKLDPVTGEKVQFVGRGLAGLVAFKMGYIDRALDHVQAVLDIVAASGLAQQTVHTLKVPLQSYEVLKACGQEGRAGDLLQQAYDLLNERADRITDPEQRARFLLNVADHRQIITLYEQKTGALLSAGPSDWQQGRPATTPSGGS